LPKQWILSTGTVKQDVSFNYILHQHDVQVELYMFRKNKEENKKIFDELLKHRREIETAFGEPLVWERLENRKCCRIKKVITIGGEKSSREKWPQIHKAMIDVMVSRTIYF